MYLYNDNFLDAIFHQINVKVFCDSHSRFWSWIIYSVSPDFYAFGEYE